MKTLDEVIANADEWRENVRSCDSCVCHPATCPYQCDIADALHYLKNYLDTKEWLDLEKRNYAEAIKNCERAEAKYTQMTLDMNRNIPLTWDELKQMEGKPVWFEGYAGNFWCIVREMQKNSDGTEDVIFDGPHGMTGVGHDDQYGDKWQAYRKERADVQS